MPKPKKKPTGEVLRRTEYMPLEKIQPADRNPKAHDLGALHSSIDRFGFVEPIVLDERTGKLVAGHGRVEALAQVKAQGGDAPEGVQVLEGGRWYVPVVRGWSSKDDHEAEAYLVASNRVGELGGWDEDLLGEMLGDLAQLGEDGGETALRGTGYDGDDVDQLLQERREAVQPTATEKDEIPDLPPKPWVKLGDLFELGDHRLICGDSNDPAVRARLLAGVKVDAVIEDPPYAVFGSSTGIGADIADDKMILPFLDKVCETIAEILPWFGHAYVFCDWRTLAPWVYAGRAANLTQKNRLTWDKGGAGLGSMWANTTEDVIFWSKTPPARAMASNKARGERMVYKPNVLRFSRPAGEEREHNAAKPVALLAELVEAATDLGGVVFDGFSGSGSLLMACEAKGRRAFAADLKPKWVQVTIERWERLTGKKARKIE